MSSPFFICSQHENSNMKKYINLLVAFLFIASAGAQIPDGYYDGTDGLAGQDLKMQLHKIIRDHKVRSYSEFRDVILRDLDEDPNNPDNIIMFYKNNSIPKSSFNSGGDGWNREHTWPKSHGFPEETDTAYTDCVNLRPSDASVNTNKSNKDFNDVAHIAANEEGEAPDTYTTSEYWEPRDEIKGDVARILMYMDTRYESSRLDLELVDYKTWSPDPELGVLYTLLRWHIIDPVDDAERERNDGVYKYQENRNPFVDHPEFVSAIWGDVSGPFLALDESSFTADFGAVEFGGDYTQNYVVNAYNLEADVTVSVEAPFYLSLDNSSFSNTLTLSHANGETKEDFTVYVKFEPEQADGETFTKNIIHESTNLSTVSLEVKGKEGEASLMTIAEARTKQLGEVVNVTGVILGGENNSSTSRVLYDGTAGIVIRSPDGETNQTAPLVIGDSVVVSGALKEYADLLQINQVPMEVTLISSDAQLPEPKVLTIAEIGETYESQLVVIKNATFSDAGKKFAGGGSDGNFDLSDGTGTITFRIGNSGHPLVGSTIPPGEYDVVGYVGQFVDDYQITPRNTSDLSPSEEEPVELEEISIADARMKSVGESVKIRGIVIGGENNNSANRAVFDGTAGLIVRGLDIGNLTADLETGDSVIVSGKVVDYNGLFEIAESVKYEVLNKGNTLPAPQSISISEFGEEYESELVSVAGVSISETGVFAAGNYTIADETGSTVLRIGTTTHPLIDTEIPEGTFDMIGYVGQDNETYQLFTRSLEDISNIEEVIIASAKHKSDMVYPNPVEGQINLYLNGAKAKLVTLYNLSGELISERRPKENSIDVSNIATGVYFILVHTEQDNYYSKVIIR